MAWLVAVLVILLALLILVKVIQILFGLLAIAIITVAFIVLRTRMGAGSSGRAGGRRDV